MLIEPDFKELQLPAERLAAQRYEDNARAFVLQAKNEPLDNRDAAVLTNSPETGCDASEIAPSFERVTPELLALVADDVFGRRTCVVDDAINERLNRCGCRSVLEYGRTHNTSRIVVNGHRHPPAEWPTLR